MTGLKRLIVAGVAAVVALVVGATVAWTAIPGADGVVHACYKTGTGGSVPQGTLIAIDSAATCPSGYSALNWNQTGPAGISGYQVVQNVYAFPVGLTTSNLTAFATCPSGKKPIGGGFRFDPPSSPLWHVIYSQPYGDDPANPTSWFAAIKPAEYPTTPTTTPMTLTAYAVCATVT